MKRLLLYTAVLLLAGPAEAQFATTTTTAPVGDSTNRIASTSFVQQNIGSPTNLSAAFDTAFCASRGAIVERSATGWACSTPGTSGLPWVSNGPGADPAYQALTAAGIAAATITSTQIASGTVANSNLANMAANTVKGSIAGGAPVDLTTAQHTSLCNVFTSSLSGCVSASGGGTTNFLRADGTWSAPTVSAAAPTVQRFTTGTTQTYTPTVGMVRIKVRMAGGGGGGGAGTTNNGANGSDTSFGTWTAIHGNGGATANGTVGAGGTGGVNGTGTLVNRVAGGSGNGTINVGASVVSGGGGGGNNPFGGAGGGASNAVAGQNAAANSGAGGGGGAGGAAAAGGSGGGAGEYVEFWMTAAQVGSSQTYTVGGGGNGGAAGGQAGGNGAAGIIIVEEFYI